MRPAAALLVLLLASGARAEPVPRTVLALYDPARIPGAIKDPYFHDLHQHAEVVLNYLGVDVEYVDVTKALPPPASRPDVRGVVAWFNTESPLRDSAAVCRWLSAGLKSGWRVALVGRLGLFPAAGRDRMTPDCAEALKTIGFEAAGNVAVEAVDLGKVVATPVASFERRPDASDEEIGGLPLIRLAAGARGSAELTVALPRSRWPLTQPVAVGPRGAVALDPFFLYANEQLDPPQYRWVTDPFAFFERAFALQGLPRPDPTTLSGRRLFMTQVDGDGFFNFSELDHAKTAGEIFLREFVEKMPDVPFTLSLIEGYFDLALYDDERSVELARRALRAVNVEPASHGYAHPSVWREGKVALRIPRYVYDVKREVVEAAQRLSERFLGGKPVSLMLWTGDGLPGEDAVSLAESAGLLNMNGGGGRFDRRHPSYSNLFPLARRLGSARQIYAPAYNENIYTALWSGPFYGYREVVETFRKTGSPRRIKPVDVYVHYYSAERYAAVEALRSVYAWARSEALIPVFASRYVRAARGFFDMRIDRTGPRRFRLTGGAALRTVRFDAESGAPDLAASKGVIGWKREGKSLYVSLDESDGREVVLRDSEGGGPRLEEADFEPLGWRSAGGVVSFEKRGFGRGECVIAGLSAGRTYRASGPGFEVRAKADGTGRLRLVFPRSESGRPAAAVKVEPA